MTEPQLLEDIPLTASSDTMTESSTTAELVLSKNARKKLAREERFQANKLERRAKEKEKKKEKKRATQAKRDAGELDDDEEEEARNKKRAKFTKTKFGGKIVVDLGFDGMMSEKEIKSLCSQLGYTYSVNRNASFPFSMLYTSLNGRTLARMESMSDAGYKRWTKTEWWQESYQKLWLGSGEPTTSESNSALATNDVPPEATTNSSSIDDTATDPDRQAIQQNVVYLTADADDELTELNPNEIYIIGGIVDHNRYKNLCLDKAKKSNIRTARLPIGRYLASLPTRKVLAVNHVVEILIQWAETRDWAQAFHAVIPQRKFVAGKVRGKGTSGEAAGEDAEEKDGETEPEEVPKNSADVDSNEKVIIVAI